MTTALSLFFGWTCLSGIVISALGHSAWLYKRSEDSLGRDETNHIATLRELNHLRSLEFISQDWLSADLRAHLSAALLPEGKYKSTENPEICLTTMGGKRAIGNIAAQTFAAPRPRRRTRRKRRGGKRLRHKMTSNIQARQSQAQRVYDEWYGLDQETGKDKPTSIEDEEELES